MTDREVMQMALEALFEAQDEIREWGSYASEYFQKKHDLLGSIAKLQPVINTLRQALAQPNAGEGVDGSVRVFFKRDGAWERVDSYEKALNALARPDWTTDTPVPPFKYFDSPEYKIAHHEQEPVAYLNIEVEGTGGYLDWDNDIPANWHKSIPLCTAPPKREQWTPVEIGVDVTHEGAHVVGMYVLMPEAVRHVFYSQFHPAPAWRALTDDEIVNLANLVGWNVQEKDFPASLLRTRVIGLGRAIHDFILRVNL